MKSLVAILMFFTSPNSIAGSCIDISGAYDYHRDGGDLPNCAKSEKVVRSWVKFEQNGCETLASKVVYKLASGDFCESDQSVTITDGQERDNGDVDYPVYSATLFPDKLVSIIKDKSGTAYTTTFKFDLHDDLQVGDSFAYRIYLRSFIR